jgi:glutaredoxin/glutathione-dependent peroxiredoxin
MPSSRDMIIGRKIPAAMLAELVDGEIVPIRACDLLGRGHVLAVGVPGAFTPVCSEQHLPNLVSNADKLRRSGFDHLVCVVAGDPFVTQAWSRVVDPSGRIRFVSDGNLNLARALGLNIREHKLFLGERSERYMLSIRNNTIETVRVEQQIVDYSCTRTDEFVLDNV